MIGRVKPRDETKARDILAATLHEVEAHGLTGLSIEAVARRAGVATGTVYIYFKNKDALLNELYLVTKRELASLAFRDEGEPVRVAFSRMCGAYVQYLLDHRAEIHFMAQVVSSPFLTAETRTAAAASYAPLHELLERGKRELLLKDLDTPLMLAFLQGTLKELAPIVGAAPRAERKKKLEQISQLCWDALRA